MPDKPPRKDTREYNLEEARDARAEREAMADGHRKEKITLIRSHERVLKSKSLIIYALIAANLFQGAMLLGKSLDLKATPDGGLEVTTGDATATPEAPAAP